MGHFLWICILSLVRRFGIGRSLSAWMMDEFVPIPYLSAAIDSAPLVSYPLILYLIPVMTLAPPQTKPPEKLADAPFDDAQADLILQSSDEVPTHFRVFKNILSLASPVFGDMFTLPSPPSENPHDEVQVVPLSEDSITLDIALRHIYPLRRTQPSEADNLRYARILAEFARKYQVEGLDQFIKGYLKDSLECDPATDPVGVYAIAVTYGYNDIGRSAAHTCLTLPFYDLRSPYLPCATLEHILELLRYHVACGEAASNLASSDRSWLSSLVLAEDITSKRGSRMCSQCTVTDFTSQTSSKSQKVLVPRGVWTYLHRSALILPHHPAPDVITEEAFVLKTNDCQECVPYLRLYMLGLSVQFLAAIVNALEQIPFPKAVSVGPSGTPATAID